MSAISGAGIQGTLALAQNISTAGTRGNMSRIQNQVSEGTKTPAVRADLPGSAVLQISPMGETLATKTASIRGVNHAPLATARGIASSQVYQA